MRGTALFLNDLFMKRPEHVGLFILVGICTGEVWLEPEVVARLWRVPHLPVVCAQISADRLLTLGCARSDVVPVKEMFVLQEKLERLLADAAVSQEANDTHSGSYQKVNHGALVLVIRRKGFLPETRSHTQNVYSNFPSKISTWHLRFKFVTCTCNCRREPWCTLGMAEVPSWT